MAVKEPLLLVLESVLLHFTICIITFETRMCRSSLNLDPKWTPKQNVFRKRQRTLMVTDVRAPKQNKAQN